MRKIFLLLFGAVFIMGATTRTQDGDALISADHTKTWTMPAATDTMVGRASTDTLTNKSISGSTNTITNVSLTTGVTGTLPLGNGGTNATTKAGAFDSLSPMTTGGDVIYGGTSGTGTRLANGTSGQVLTSSGGTAAPSWTTVVTSSSTIATKTANYTLVSGDGTTIVDATSGGFTITLASASSVSGQRFVIKRKDSVIANQVTITGTIDGASDWKLYTVNETLEVQSDGTSYYQIKHDTETAWSSTATITITGTTTNPTKASSVVVDTIRWRRHGNMAEIWLSYKHTSATGTAAGSGDYEFATPTNLTMDTTDISLYTTVLGNSAPSSPNNIGHGSAVNGTTNSPCIISAYDSTHVRILPYGNTANGSVASGNFAITGATIAYHATYMAPISGWKP